MVDTFHNFLLSILFQLVMHDLCIKREICNFNFKIKMKSHVTEEIKIGYVFFPLCLIKSVFIEEDISSSDPGFKKSREFIT